jgi:serine phosphatase RsbU (regulator of sigma subunit)/anti-sigma regulatory factor (Ser/Thr protein kinase)
MPNALREAHRVVSVAPRSWSERYGVALLATAVGVGTTSALLALDAEPIYAPMAGAVLLSAWFCGIGPAVLSVVIGWTLALWLLVEPRGSLDLGSTDDMVRWAINLAVASLIVVIAAVLRIGRQRATAAAEEAESSLGQADALLELSSQLAAAASSAEVSHALAAHAAALLDAQGAALGLLESDDVLVVDPIGLARSVNVPGRRIALDQETVLTAAVRTGELVRANDRATLERTFPDSSAILPPAVQSVIAVPLRRASRLYGVAEFLFDRPNAVDDRLASLASTIATVAEQALERAHLYERERETRTALERILQVSPRFYADSADEATRAICREARTTFGADYGVLWRIDDRVLELVRSDPERSEWPPGLRVPLTDFPGLLEAVENLGVSFVPDVLDEAKSDGLDRVRELGIRSSLRSPVAIGGKAELVLVVSWQTVVDEPDPATIAVIRRFADQAGLAIGQLARRRAEKQAALLADETARLQEVTAALSLAASRTDVGDTCLQQAIQFVGAHAGFVVLAGSGGTSVQMISSSGYSEEALAAWRALGLDADVPFARAIESGEPVWALTQDEMGTFRGAPALGDAGWVSVPLRTPAGIHGALHLSLKEPRELSPGERRWLQTAVSQCALALERSQLYDEEQRLREQSERLLETTSALSNALTQADVAEVVVEAAVESTGAVTATLYAVSEERQVARRLAARGTPSNGDESGGDIPLDGELPVSQVIARSAWWSEGPTEDPAETLRTLVVVPLVSGRRTLGALELTWEEPTAFAAARRVFVQTLASQGAQALDRARRFESERSIAETLQRSVLPAALPRVAGVQLAARYLPGTMDVDVGGDWFDAVELTDGRVGLVVGDVVGKGVQAAAAMGQLRNALRAISIERLKPPTALARLDRLASDGLEASFATVIYAVYDPAAGVLRFSSAGHPPPVVAYPDGRVELLEDGRGLPLGTGLGAKYRQSVIDIPAGSVVLLYSDGLVERRGHTIDEGIESFVEAVETGPRDAETLLEHVLGRLTGEDRTDDVAILAARFLPVAPRPLDLTVRSEEDSLHLVRDSVRTWLQGTTLSRSDAEDLLLAAWEVCANAIEHAAEPTDDLVRIRALVDDSRITITVDDLGRFVRVGERTDRGLGLRLAEHLVSAVDITMSEDGTTVALEKRLPEGDDLLREAR